MLQEAITGFALVLGYYALVALTLVLLQRYTSASAETRRKVVHLLCVLSIFVYLYRFDTWWIAALCAVFFAVMLLPVVALLERSPQFGAIVAERRAGEVRSSLVIVSLMMAGLITLFWGMVGEQARFIVILAVLAWGLGDAAAALVGKKHGKRYLEGRLIEGRKTVEGTAAMFVVAFGAIWLTLVAFSPLSWWLGLVIALPVALLCAVVELYSRWGTDTITVPLSAALSASLILYLLT